MYSSGYPLRLVVWQVDRVSAHAAVQWKWEKSMGYVQGGFLYCQAQNYGVLQHSISDMAQSDNEFKQKPLHTDS